MCKWRMSKKDKMADGIPEGSACPIPPSMGQFFPGGDGSFSRLVWKSIWNEHKIIAWSCWPCMTPNDYLSIVFHQAVSLHGSCRKNALPWPQQGKLQLFPACEKSFLLITTKEYAICTSICQIETYSLEVEDL